MRTNEHRNHSGQLGEIFNLDQVVGHPLLERVSSRTKAPTFNARVPVDLLDINWNH